MLDASRIAVGDVMVPDRTWNRTSGKYLKLPGKVTVSGVRRVRSQTGYMLKVTSKHGVHMWLDAGWFTSKVID